MKAIETAGTMSNHKRWLLFRHWCDVGCKDKEVGSETNTDYCCLKQNKVSSTNLHNIKQCFCLWDIFIWYLIVFPSKFNNRLRCALSWGIHVYFSAFLTFLSPFGPVWVSYPGLNNILKLKIMRLNWVNFDMKQSWSLIKGSH